MTLTSCLYQDTYPLLSFLKVFPYLPMSGVFPKGSYHNSQSNPHTVSSLEGYSVLTCIHLHHLTEKLQTTVTTVFTLFQWLVENEETDNLLDLIVQ